MQLYKNTATSVVKSREDWILTLPKDLISPGEGWDSLINELLDIGLFLDVSEPSLIQGFEMSPIPVHSFESFSL